MTNQEYQDYLDFLESDDHINYLYEENDDQ